MNKNIENNKIYSDLQKDYHEMKAQMKHMATNIKENKINDFISSVKSFMGVVPQDVIARIDKKLELTYIKKEEKHETLSLEFHE